MVEKNYSKRELDTAITAIKDHLTKQDETLSRIEMQTTKTNGRVNKLEYWRNAVAWGFGILIILVPSLITLLTTK